MLAKTHAFEPRLTDLAGLIKGEVDGPKSCYCLDREKLNAFQGKITALITQVLQAPPCDECC